MARFGRRQPFKPLIKRPAVPVVLAPAQRPVGKIVMPAGRFAAHAAVQAAHRLFFKPILKTLGIGFPPRLPVSDLVRKFPTLGRVFHKEDEQRLDRFTSLLSDAFNSLGRQGLLRRVEQERWQLGPAGAIEAVRAPSVVDDETRDYALGMIWVRTDTDEAWVCVSAAEGAAVWLALTSPGVDGGTF